MKKINLLGRFNNLPIGLKIVTVITLILTVSLSIFVFNVRNQVEKSLEDSLVRDLSARNELITEQVDVFNESIVRASRDLAKVFASYFPGGFTVDTSKTIAVGGVAAPVLTDFPIIPSALHHKTYTFKRCL